jgi:hypothetical protein
VWVSRSYNLVLCMFCDRIGSVTDEDIISTWMRKPLGGGPHFFADQERHSWESGLVERSVGRKPKQKVNLLLVPVCHKCNNGWMSRLEKLVIPIVTQLIGGELMPLTVDQRRLMATWAQLKSITYDAWYGETSDPKGRRIPPWVAWEFYGRQQPSPHLSVAFFPLDRVPGEYVRHARRTGSPRVEAEEVLVGSRKVNVIRTTLVFGECGIQSVYGYVGSDVDASYSVPVELPHRALWSPASKGQFGPIDLRQGVPALRWSEMLRLGYI